MPIIRIIILVTYICTILNLLISPDFVAVKLFLKKIIILTYIIIIFYTTFNQNQLDNLTKFTTLSFISVIIDIVGFFITGVDNLFNIECIL